MHRCIVPCAPIKYNGEHRHSAIRYVTPDERHGGREKNVLAHRHALYQRARDANPERWSYGTRNWAPVGPVLLNPINGLGGKFEPCSFPGPEGFRLSTDATPRACGAPAR